MNLHFPLPERLYVYAIRTRYVCEVAEILGRVGHTSAIYVDNLEHGPRVPPVEPVMNAAHMPGPDPNHGLVIPVFDPILRRRVHTELLGSGRTFFPRLVDPTSVIASSADLDEGTIVNASVVIAANTTIGRFVSVNRSASIGHDTTIGDFVSLGPASVLTGNCQVNDGAFVGAGATIIPGTEIGAHSVVGAGSVVIANVPPRTLVVGNPARAVRELDG